MQPYCRKLTIHLSVGHHHHHHNGTENIRVAFWLNLAFTIIEIIGGFLTNSLAILSDALHDLGDSLSLGLAWYFQNLSKKGRDRKFSYGYRRFSLLGAIINSIVLVVGSIFIITEAIPRVMDPQSTNATGMIGLAILGVLVNGAAVLKLKKGHTQNEKVAALHLLEDVLGWVAVLIGSIIIYFTNWFIIDPLLSLGIALFILFNVYKSIKSSMSKIAVAPVNADIESAVRQGEKVQQVEAVGRLDLNPQLAASGQPCRLLCDDRDLCLQGSRQSLQVGTQRCVMTAATCQQQAQCNGR